MGSDDLSCGYPWLLVPLSFFRRDTEAPSRGAGRTSMDCCLGTAISSGGDFESCGPSMPEMSLLYWEMVVRGEGKGQERRNPKLEAFDSSVKSNYDEKELVYVTAQSPSAALSLDLYAGHERYEGGHPSALWVRVRAEKMNAYHFRFTLEESVVKPTAAYISSVACCCLLSDLLLFKETKKVRRKNDKKRGVGKKTCVQRL